LKKFLRISGGRYKKMAGLVVFAFILRLLVINQSFWLDEAISVLTARDLSPSQILNQYLPTDFHPPGYYLWLHFWGQIFGWSEPAMRLPSVFFGTATVYLVYLIAKQIFKAENPALTAALFLATAPFHIYYSQEARMYSMATFLTTLSIYFFIKIINYQDLSIKKTKRAIIGYLFSTVLLVYTSYYGFLIILTQGLIAIIFKKYSFLFWILIVFFLFTPWLPTLLAQFRYGSQMTQALPEWSRLVNLGFFKALPLTFIKFSLGRITIFNKKLYLALAGSLFFIYSGIILKGFFKKRKLTASRQRLIISLWLVFPLSLAWLASFFVPNYQPFRLLLILPAFYLLLTAGIYQIKSPIGRLISLGLVLIVNLSSLGVYYLNPYFQREDWRGLVQAIEADSSPDSAVILLSPQSQAGYSYYSQGSSDLVFASGGVKFTTQEPDRNLEKGLKTKNRVFYLRYLISLFDPEERVNFWLIKHGFAKIREISFNQIPVWEYQKSEVKNQI
jgi:mannosyltransferase